jgi:hypothetical protein
MYSENALTMSIQSTVVRGESLPGLTIFLGIRKQEQKFDFGRENDRVGKSAPIRGQFRVLENAGWLAGGIWGEKSCSPDDVM